MSKNNTPRTIIKTATPGWYDDPETQKKTRKREGDIIVTNEEYQEGLRELVELEEQNPSWVVTVPVSVTDQETSATVEIKDCWVEPDNRTAKQRKLFGGPKRELSYEKVVKAADGDKDAMPSGEVRMVKPQDAFQVRFTEENQKKYAREQRRRRNAAKKNAVAA